MSLPQAFSNIALAVSDAMGGPFYSARVVTQAITQDEGGDTIKAEPTYRTCSVQVDLVSDDMRASGTVEGEARFMVLSATLSGTLGTDEEIEVLSGPHTGVWQVSKLERDPAAIGWVGVGRRG